jgi:Glycerophosphoryl diester phosphodiesterase
MWPYPNRIAHRGGGVLAPENTIAALNAALGYGYHAAEVDAALSRDEVPVLLHDASLERTTDGNGCVCDYSVDELTWFDAGERFAPEFLGEPIPTLEQALRACAHWGIWLNVEIKPVPGFEKQTGTAVARTVARFCAKNAIAGDRVPLLSSFSVVALEAARRAAPHLPRGYLVSRIGPKWRRTLEHCGCASLHCEYHALDEATAHAVKDAGFGLLCYTVDDPARVRTLESWGVDAVVVDRIDLIPPDEAARGNAAALEPAVSAPLVSEPLWTRSTREPPADDPNRESAGVSVLPR